MIAARSLCAQLASMCTFMHLCFNVRTLFCFDGSANEICFDSFRYYARSVSIGNLLGHYC